MKFYNTLTHQVEEFTPSEPGHVRMYNCGPTVYGDQHVGNYRTFAFADTLRRYFEFKGWKVTQIINITDVGHLTQDDIDSGEDKIDVMARQMKWTAMQVAEHFMNRFYADRKTLLMREPARFTRATDHIGDMIAMAVRNENVIGGNLFHVDLLCEWVGRDEGIEEERFAAGLDGKAGMTIVSELHRCYAVDEMNSLPAKLAPVSNRQRDAGRHALLRQN